jgi:hypothetical protein
VTPLLIVVSPTYADARTAMADRVIRGEWAWVASLPIAQRWIERMEVMGASVSATIWVAGETVRKREAA